MLGLAAVPAVVQFFGVSFLPESPRWLVANQRSEQAKAVLMRLRDTEGGNFELGEIEQSVRHTSQLPRASWRDLWTVPTTRRAIVLGCGLMILQQLAGINMVMYYSGLIYNMAGFNVETSTWLAGFTALAQFFGMVTNLSMVERLGRRTLVLWSLATVFLSLIAIGLSFYLHDIVGTRRERRRGMLLRAQLHTGPTGRRDLLPMELERMRKPVRVHLGGVNGSVPVLLRHRYGAHALDHRSGDLPSAHQVPRKQHHHRCQLDRQRRCLRHVPHTRISARADSVWRVLAVRRHYADRLDRTLLYTTRDQRSPSRGDPCSVCTTGRRRLLVALRYTS